MTWQPETEMPDLEDGDDGLTVIDNLILLALVIALLAAGFLAGIVTWMWW